ncbi:unnamed protein product [Linum tenue]|uniref:Uncharacterized protein n=1 Tax=Linum tenue TaxID=586396 RepID=A0AAV0JSR0_9ROSI|nr:unnamed protein product [Linum tenue]
MTSQEVAAKEEGASGGEDYHDHAPAAKDYRDPPPVPLIDLPELGQWSFYRAIIAEFIATLLFLYITVLTIIGHNSQPDPCARVGLLGIAWAAVTFGLFLARKVSLIRAVTYMVAQCLGAICGVALVKAFQESYYTRYGGGANTINPAYSTGTGLGAEIIGTFVLVYTVFSATDPKRNARDSHVPVLAPLPIGFAVFIVHLATIPITGTGINPARSFGAAVIFNEEKPWDDHWIFWVGPFVGAAAAAFFYQKVMRAGTNNAFWSFSNKGGS